MTRVLLVRSLAILGLAAVFLLPGSIQARGGFASGQLGEVKAIKNGLGVQPPGQGQQKGSVNMRLFNSYGLHTGKSELASVGFKDGTILHLNQNTDAVLRSPTMTVVKSGQVDQSLVPGANHKIQTNAAVATAIGTNLMVRIFNGGSYFMVLHGAALIANKFGSVVVKNDQGSLVVPGQAPQPPYPIDAPDATTWTNSLPHPNLGENIAVDGDGGHVVGFSSQFTAAGSNDYGLVPYGNAATIIDGRLDSGWESAPGHPTNQWVKIGFTGDAVYRVSKVIIDPAPWQSNPASAFLKDFEIRVSTTGTADADFHTVLRATCQQKAVLQRFKLPAGTRARFVELFAVSNYGDPTRVGVAELEVVSKGK